MTILKILQNNLLLKGKIPLVSAIFAGMIIAICLLGIIVPQTTSANFNTSEASYIAKKVNETAETAVKRIKVVITAYSSTPDQTDSTPFITASGKQVRDGVIANNLLPLGTKVKIPGLYGNKVFTVEDRMNKKKGDYHIDVWFPTRQMALNFGVKTSYIEVLED